MGGFRTDSQYFEYLSFSVISLEVIVSLCGLMCIFNCQHTLLRLAFDRFSLHAINIQMFLLSFEICSILRLHSHSQQALRTLPRSLTFLLLSRTCELRSSSACGMTEPDNATVVLSLEQSAVLANAARRYTQRRTTR